MPRLVALDLPGGPGFVDELRRIWDAGDAAFPVDQRLPAAAKRDVYAAMRVGEPVEPGDALVVATSGSTGAPKGVVLTHAAVAASAAATSARIGVAPDDHWLACLPLNHVGGLSVVTRALHAGTPLTVLPGFDAAAVMASGATLVSLVATALQRIDPAAFRVIVLGGARPPAERPPNTVATYGMTETGSGVVYDRRPLDGVEVRIVQGEIQLRGPMLLRCYRDGHDPTTADGWLATGDLGTFDGGLLTVHGRADDLIITGGENVWPEPVEAVLRRVPGVADVAVAGTPDPEWGQVVTAHVVGEVTLDALRAAVKEQLPAFCAPRRLVLHRTLPRTSLGKLQRHSLDTDPGG
ncbi:MAG TPA: fatty acid--CoA ligase family protein [Ilumatobacter sp.]|nr:fatty acid--CoA ligase family protein [Ilumatobacter sp.]